MRLTDNEIRDIVKYLEAGKPLPEKFRFLLFEEKREVELVWNEKTQEYSDQEFLTCANGILYQKIK